MSLDASVGKSRDLVNSAYEILGRDLPERDSVLLEALQTHHISMIESIGDLPRLAREALAAALDIETKPLAEVTSLDTWSKRARP